MSSTQLLTVGQNRLVNSMLTGSQTNLNQLLWSLKVGDDSSSHLAIIKTAIDQESATTERLAYLRPLRKALTEHQQHLAKS